MDEFEGAMAVAEAPAEEAEELKPAPAKEAVETKAAPAKDKVSYDVDLDYNMEWEVETEPVEPDVIISEEAEEEPYYRPYAPRAARSINKHLFVWVFNLVCGMYGVDRFVRGQVAMGVFKILTIGGLGFWYLTDLIIAIVKAYGSYNDSEDLFFDEYGRYLC